MADGEELAIEFYEAGNALDLARCLIQFLTNPERQQAMAVQNFSTGLRMTMATIVLKSLRHFELEQRTEALRRVTRFRRLPGWVPSKALLLRMMTRNSPGWVHRSAIPRLPSNNPGRQSLLNDDVDGRGKLSGTGVSHNGDGVTVGDGYRSILDPIDIASARSAKESDAHKREQGEGLSATPAHAAGENETRDSERHQPSRKDWERFSSLGNIHSGNGSSGDGKSGSRGPGTGSNGSGREGAAHASGEAATGERDRAVERPGLQLRIDREYSRMSGSHSNVF